MNEPVTAVTQSWLSSHKRNTRNTSWSNYIILLSVKIDAHPIRTKLKLVNDDTTTKAPNYIIILMVNSLQQSLYKPTKPTTCFLMWNISSN